MNDTGPASPRLHPLVAGFSDAETYDRGRPVSDPAVAAALIERLGLAPGAPVLELGAGTGQLSRALVAGGLDLTAVEPLGPTRALLAAAIGEQRVRDGVAEQIPLPDGSVDAVFAADSFHWFDPDRAMPEIKRVLRPRGGVAILRTVPSWDQPWAQELAAIMMANRPAHPGFDGGGAADALEHDPDMGPVLESSSVSSITVDRDRVLAWIASTSWVAMLAPEKRSELLSSIEQLLQRHNFARLTHEVQHQIWIARLLPRETAPSQPLLRL